MVSGCIAQLVEQLTLNQWVQGSSPCASTKNKNDHLVVFFMHRARTRPELRSNKGFENKYILQAKRSEIVTVCAQGFARVSPCASTKNKNALLGVLFL